VPLSGEFPDFDRPYDPDDRDSCLRHARKLQEAGSLRKAIHSCVPTAHRPHVIRKVEETLRAGGKGALGNAIEVGHFYYLPNSSTKPDLNWAELKCTGLVPDGDGGRRAKERLVICMINYGGDPDSKIPCVVEETAETSHAFKKLLSILLVFYDYAKVDTPEEFLDLPIRLVDTWAPSPEDVALFKRDWEVIQGYVIKGRAHELSEGLTPLLGACTKSSDSKKRVKQRVGSVEAKPRAFALKQAFVTEIFRSLHASQVEAMVKETAIADQSFRPATEQDLEAAILERLRDFNGISTVDICERMRLEGKFGGKSGQSRRMRKLIDAISVELKGLPIEALDAFRKSGLRICVCRILKNDEAAEAVSFPAFEYAEVADETEWEDSSLYQDLVKRFLFVFLRDDEDDSCPRFDKAVFWSMPEKDLDVTQVVWADTVRLIGENRLEELPAESTTYAVHVRPHDKHRYPGFKRSYWLNHRYVTKIWSGEA
jgi:DNA mismatch repair protein MutH